MKPRGLGEEFQRGRAPEVHQVLGVFTQNNAVLGLDVMGARRINDRIYSGPRGAVQRYTTSMAAADVAKKPYESAR